MNDELNMTPSLTLEPDLSEKPAPEPAPTATAAAVQAPAAPAAPSLTLENAITPEDAAAAQKARDENAIKLDESQLTEAERKIVDDFAKKIDIRDSNVVMQYGAAAQKNIVSFSENALNNVRTKDLGSIGEDLSSLVVQLKTFGEPEKKGLGGWFQKKKNEALSLKASYEKAEVNVDKIAAELEKHQVTLM